MRRLRNPDDADDVLQDAQLAVLQSPAAQAARKPAAYLFRTAINLIIGVIADREHGPVTYDSEAADSAAVGLPGNERDIIDQLVSEAQLEAVLGKIPDHYRRVLLMQERDGLSHQEIADRLHMPLETIKTYVKRAKRIARELQWK